MGNPGPSVHDPVADIAVTITGQAGTETKKTDADGFVEFAPAAGDWKVTAPLSEGTRQVDVTISKDGPKVTWVHLGKADSYGPGDVY